MDHRYDRFARYEDAGLGAEEFEQGIERQSITESANTIVGRLERLADHLEARTVLANGSGPSASDQEPAEANEPNPRGEIQ